MDPFLAAFFPQLLATVAGAVIGIAGVVWGFDLQRRAGSADAMDRAVENLLLRLDEWTQMANEGRRGRNFNTVNMSNRLPVFLPPAPHDGRVSIAIELLRVKVRDRGWYRARARDITVVNALLAAWDQIAPGTFDGKERACGVVAGAVMKWRTGAPIVQVQESLDFAIKISREDVDTAN